MKQKKNVRLLYEIVESILFSLDDTSRSSSSSVSSSVRSLLSLKLSELLSSLPYSEYHSFKVCKRKMAVFLQIPFRVRRMATNGFNACRYSQKYGLDVDKDFIEKMSGNKNKQK